MVGLDIGVGSIKAVELQKKEGILSLTGLALKNRSGADDASLTQDLKQILTQPKFSSGEINISVCGPLVAVRPVELPDMTDKEIRDAVKFEAEKFIPFKIEEGILDYQVLNRDTQSKRSLVLLAAAKKDFVQGRLDAISKAGLIVKCVDADGIALTNAFMSAYPQREKESSDLAFALLHAGDGFFNLSIVHKKYPLVLRDIPQVKDASDMDKPAKELKLSLGYFENQFGKEVETLYLSGELSKFPGLKEFLSEEAEVHIELWDPFAAVKIGEGIDLKELEANRPRLTVAFGLAVRND
ncbi:MAG: pilus assembly protein PilM [Candidatus Omnitrophica bacterium]|nr:pilus assembly protein PilM [Candidatus Omnitrophota bacterium]